MVKYPNFIKELYEFAKNIDFDKHELFSHYDFFKKKYSNISYKNFKNYCYMVCNKSFKVANIEYHDYNGKSIKHLLEDVCKENDYDTIPVYKKFSEFKEKYNIPNLHYETFTRAVRKVCYEHKNKRTEIYDEKNKKELVKEIKRTSNKISFVKDDNNQSFKRMVILSDLHCGHIMGLTPPAWQFNKDNIDLQDIANIQKDAWDWYTSAIKKVGKNIDVLVVNGDLIDGRGEKSGSNELITVDRMKQVSIGVECLSQWNAKQIFMTRGTPYHTGNQEQFEDLASERLGALIDDSLNIKINNKIFNFKHKVASSSVPYGKTTPVVKEGLWNLIQSVYNDVPSADVIVRSHVHHLAINQDSSKYCIVTPALQVNSRYGKQQCTGISDYGFIVVDIYENGYIQIMPYIANIKNEEHGNIIEL